MPVAVEYTNMRNSVLMAHAIVRLLVAIRLLEIRTHEHCPANANILVPPPICRHRGHTAHLYGSLIAEASRCTPPHRCVARRIYLYAPHKHGTYHVHDKVLHRVQFLHHKLTQRFPGRLRTQKNTEIQCTFHAFVFEVVRLKAKYQNGIPK